MTPNTHLGINPTLCGQPVQLEAGSATVEMVATDTMAADERGLVHGGFVFGMADYAAMLAVNDPNVVLGSSDVRFLKPVVVGGRLVAAAKVVSEKGKKRTVDVSVAVEDQIVLTGTFIAFVLETHVLGSPQ